MSAEPNSTPAAASTTNKADMAVGFPTLPHAEIVPANPVGFTLTDPSSGRTVGMIPAASLGPSSASAVNTAHPSDPVSGGTGMGEDANTDNASVKNEVEDDGSPITTLTRSRGGGHKADPDSSRSPSPSPGSVSKKRKMGPAPEPSRTVRPRRAFAKGQYLDDANEDKDENGESESEVMEDEDEYHVKTEQEEDGIDEAASSGGDGFKAKNGKNKARAAAPAKTKAGKPRGPKGPNGPKVKTDDTAGASGPSPASGSCASARAKGRWSSADLESLFYAALGPGPTPKTFEGRVPGCSGKQGHDAWMRTLLPFLVNAIRDRDGKR